MKLRGALIGYGFISGKGHIPAYLKKDPSGQELEIVAVADICEARRSLVNEALPAARVYTDYESLLSSEVAHLDFVDICTPPADHARIAHAALDHGLHVLCEKPLTTTLEEARSLIEHAKRAGKVLFPCHNYKHAPVIKVIREIIDSGRIGKVSAVTINTYRNTHAKGVPEWKPHWRRERKHSGGGIAMDHGSHAFYLIFDWLSAYPTSITAKTSKLSSEYDTEDQLNATVSFPSGIASIHLTWTAGVRKVIYSIQGDRGAITVDDDDIQIATMEKTDGPDVAQGAVTWRFEKKSIASHWMDASHVEWHGSLFDEFKRAIESGQALCKQVEDAYRCIEVITTAYRSAHEGSLELPLKGIDLNHV